MYTGAYPNYGLKSQPLWWNFFDRQYHNNFFSHSLFWLTSISQSLGLWWLWGLVSNNINRVRIIVKKLICALLRHIVLGFMRDFLFIDDYFCRMRTYTDADGLPYGLQHLLVMPFCHPDAFPRPDPYPKNYATKKNSRWYGIFFFGYPIGLGGRGNHVTASEVRSDRLALSCYSAAVWNIIFYFDHMQI